MGRLTLRHVGILALFILSAEAVGLAGSLITFDAIPSWYAALEKPSFAPPNWLFGPVWTLLYAFMGTAAFILWRKRHHFTHAARGLRWYWIQLALNGIWTPIFFGLKRIDIALIVIVLLAFAIGKTMWEARKVSVWAVALLLPYLAWVVFASALNFALWRLN